MGAAAENFKGIEFVRISSLPDDQKKQIWQTFEHNKIIKIVKDKSLMNDCILYQDYVSWLSQQQSGQVDEKPASQPYLKLAFR
jgi:hypothetical protein